MHELHGRYILSPFKSSSQAMCGADINTHTCASVITIYFMINLYNHHHSIHPLACTTLVFRSRASVCWVMMNDNVQTSLHSHCLELHFALDNLPITCCLYPYIILGGIKFFLQMLKIYEVSLLHSVYCSQLSLFA